MLTAWRAWGLLRGDIAPPSYGSHMGEFRKQDVYVDFWTPASGVVEAVCPVGESCRSEDGRVPCSGGHGCIAGIHAYAYWRGMQESQRYTRAGRRIAGKLELSGKIAEEPWAVPPAGVLRAERARVLNVVALRPDADIAARIADRWHVPLVVLEEIDPEREPTSTDRLDDSPA